MATDLLGTDLTAAEAQLKTAYDGLKTLEQNPDLPPCAVNNVRIALAALGIAVTDLLLEYEHLTDYGC